LPAKLTAVTYKSRLKLTQILFMIFSFSYTGEGLLICIFSIAELIHELLVEVCQTLNNGRNLILLRQNCAPEVPSSRNLPEEILITVNHKSRKIEQREGEDVLAKSKLVSFTSTKEGLFFGGCPFLGGGGGGGEVTCT